ncbi:hypothetical protein GQ43DRAFT_125976 [Delitschia confertaspora ATCC 74209]|uniref:Uncharacterized protein n=1 Tax=Delitschia confertaspora ATCC 74209 TaxID=1513339 RepID=A0A9P4JGY7_9PLEO|nr:hypothetical protein GQ43DRAFT_125976 [Delitschia confertaspora ATCC 74209]
MIYFPSLNEEAPDGVMTGRNLCFHVCFSFVFGHLSMSSNTRDTLLFNSLSCTGFGLRLALHYGFCVCIGTMSISSLAVIFERYVAIWIMCRHFHQISCSSGIRSIARAELHY